MKTHFLLVTRQVIGRGPIVTSWPRLLEDLRGCLKLSIILAALVLTLSGCAQPVDKTPHSAPLNAAGASVARADTGIGTVTSMITRAYDSCSEVGQALLDAAREAADRAAADLVVVNDQLAAVDAERNELIGQLKTANGETEVQRQRADRAESNPGYVVWTFIVTWARRLWWIFLSSLALGVVLRGVAFFVTGPANASLVAGGNGLIHAGTGLISFVIKKVYGWRTAAKAAA